MIRIACTNCKTVLSIDDAFAGGVCRCQHCGTIQTVPATAKETAAAGVGGSKALFQQGSRSDSPAGLDDLASIVASSGLSGSGLTSRRLTRGGVAVTPDKPRNMMPIFIAIGAVFLLLVIVIIWLAMRGSGNAGTNSTGGEQTNSTPGSAGITPQANKFEPNFCGMKLSGNSVIYLLDRGSASKEIFAGLKDAALKSALSLGSNRMFEIVFWDNGSVTCYPENSTTYATKENVEAARRALDDVSAYGATDIKPALAKALSHSPDTIIIATAKGSDPDLDDAWVAGIITARGTSPVTIHTVSLGSYANSPALKNVASKTGGQYLELNNSALQAFLDQ